MVYVHVAICSLDSSTLPVAAALHVIIRDRLLPGTLGIRNAWTVDTRMHTGKIRSGFTFAPFSGRLRRPPHTVD